MISINMTSKNSVRNVADTHECLAWGKNISNIATVTWGNINALAFGAILIVCSFAVGCSKDEPKPVSSNNPLPAISAPAVAPPAPVTLAESKPAPKKSVVHKKPATVNYTDKTYGVSFEYSRRYAIETGNAAADVVMSNPIPMNFVQPGGVALAAVELPQTGFANTDFSSAFFNVSVHKGLTSDECSEFAVPQPKVIASSAQTSDAETKANSSPNSTAASASASTSTPSSDATVSGTSSSIAEPPNVSASPSTQTQTPEAQSSKLLLGDMELRATEAVSGEGARQSDSKYFHVYQNGSCYEFALNVTTVANQDGLIKHVDRDKVFGRLEQILDTVKINPVSAQEVTAETPATPVATGTPAQ